MSQKRLKAPAKPPNGASKNEPFIVHRFVLKGNVGNAGYPTLVGDSESNLARVVVQETTAPA